MKKIRVRSPLRLGLAGGGTDLSPYCDQHTGFVLNTTISLYVHCTLEETNNSYIEFNAIDLDKSFKTNSVEELPLDGNLDIFKACYNRIVKDYAKKPLSFRMSSYSDVPSGSGLGGSSTLVVGILAAFSEWLNLPLGEYDLALLAYKVEREDLGIIGGYQDHYAAAFGGVNFMEFFGKGKVIVNPLRIKEWILNELESSMVLYFTNVTREASQIEKEKISLMENEDSLKAMHEVRGDALHMKEALLKGNLKTFSSILEKSWKAKKRVSKSISNKNIDLIYDQAVKYGAYSGKLSGAGGGGFMYFLVDPEKKLLLTKKLNSLSGHVIPFAFVREGVQGWKV